MSDHLPDPESAARGPLDDGPTEEYPTVTQTLATPPDGAGGLAGDGEGDSDEEWVSQATHGIRLGVPAAALLALVLVAGGFWGGSALQKSQGGGSSSTSLASLAARFRTGTGARATGSAASRFGGLFASTAGTAGTVSVVDGDTLYVQTSTGSVVKVTLTKSTTITRNADATAIDLRPGDTVAVEGATGSSGSVTATSVSATAPGVTTGFAGLPDGFTGTRTGATGAGTTGSNTSTTPALFGGG
jgi:hypothetical protein